MSFCQDDECIFLFYGACYKCSCVQHVFNDLASCSGRACEKEPVIPVPRTAAGGSTVQISLANRGNINIIVMKIQTFDFFKSQSFNVHYRHGIANNRQQRDIFIDKPDKLN
jgi:hypothetical protein